jgi:hypothetical protein
MAILASTVGILLKLVRFALGQASISIRKPITCRARLAVKYCQILTCFASRLAGLTDIVRIFGISFWAGLETLPIRIILREINSV